MKLLFVGTNPEATGAATHFVALAQAMVEAGHEVSAVVFPGGLIAHSLANSGVRLYPSRFRNVFDLRGYAATLHAARELKPDWLVGNFGKEYWPLILLSRLLRVPLALFRHRTPAMGRLSGYLVPRLAQRFYAVSQHARQAYLDQGVPAGRVRVMYNPVNLALCKPDPAIQQDIRQRLGIPRDAVVLGYFGRMHGSKGIYTLLEALDGAMSENPRLHAMWLGHGPDAHAIQQRIDAGAFAQRHHVLGWIDNVQPYYSAISMLAFPSIATETFGRVSVEAQAAGAPVLASDIGGVPETLAAGVSGVLLPPGDVPVWRHAIVQMCNAELREPMGAAARTFVEQHFGTRVVAEAFARDLTGA